MNPVSLPRMLQKAQGILAKRGIPMRWRDEGPDFVRVVTPQHGPSFFTKQSLKSLSLEVGAGFLASSFMQ